MSRSKKLSVLLGILAVVCIGAFAVSRYEVEQEKIKNSDEIVLTLASDSVTELSWEYDSTELSFHRDDTWLYDGDEAFPVDDEKINGLLEQFESFGVSFIIEEVEDFGQYGLDDPVCTIHITADGEEYEISLGDYSTMDSERYVSIGDGNVYLVEHDPLEEFDAVLSDLIAHDTVPDFDTVDEIEFSGAENYSIVYEEESADTYCADDVYFTDHKPLDTANVNSYLNMLGSLDLTDYVSYNASDEELQAYGLDAPELTVTVDYTAEDEDGETSAETFVISVGRDPEESAEESAVAESAGAGAAAESADAGTDAESAAAESADAGADAGAAAESADAGSTDAGAAAESTDAGADAESADAGAENTNASTDAESADAGVEESAAEDSGEDAEDEVTAYVRIGDSRIVYRITSDEYKKLMAASYNDLRHKEVLTASFDDISQIDISLEDVDYTITSAEEDEEKIWYYNEEELDISGLKSTLTALEADSFTEEAPSQKEEIRLTVHLDHENDPEISVALYRYDGDYCLAVVDGEAVSLVERSDVVDLIEAVHAIVLD